MSYIRLLHNNTIFEHEAKSLLYKTTIFSCSLANTVIDTSIDAKESWIRSKYKLVIENIQKITEHFQWRVSKFRTYSITILDHYLIRLSFSILYFSAAETKFLYHVYPCRVDNVFSFWPSRVRVEWLNVFCIAYSAVISSSHSPFSSFPVYCKALSSKISGIE